MTPTEAGARRKRHGTLLLLDGELMLGVGAYIEAHTWFNLAAGQGVEGAA